MKLVAKFHQNRVLGSSDNDKCLRTNSLTDSPTDSPTDSLNDSDSLTLTPVSDSDCLTDSLTLTDSLPLTDLLTFTDSL